jgi:hypothetical protein
MEDMTPNIDTPDVDSGDVRAFISQYKYPLIVLGGLVVTAVVLSGVARRRGVYGGVPGVRDSRTPPGQLERTVQFSSDWENSLKHLAAAVDQRLAGFDHRLVALEQYVPDDTVVPNGNGPANQTYEAATADQPQNIAPGTASVSM